MSKKLQFLTIFFSLLLLLSGSVLGQLSAGTYTVGTGGMEDYSSLSAACADITTNGITGDVVLEITTDITENSNFGLLQTSSYTLTIKPASGVSPKIYFGQTTDNAAPSGGLLLGISDPSSWTNVGTCQNVIIDGSNNGTSSQDLTLTNTASAHPNTYPLALVADANNIVIKNLNITTASTVRKGMQIRNRYADAPNNVVIDNCVISSLTSSNGVGIDGYYSGDHSGFTDNLEVKNCTISAVARGMFLYEMEDISIHDNIFQINNTYEGVTSHGIYGYYYLSSAGIINIYNNKFTQLQTANSTTGYGIIAIEAGYSNATYNIYNNFIGGFNTTTVNVNPSCFVYGILANAYNFVNVYYNTIYLNDLSTDFGTGTLTMRGIDVYHSPKTLKNNIVFLDEDDFTAYCVYQEGSTSLTSDYNDWYVKDPTYGKVGYETSDLTTLSDWQTQTGQDANSVSRVTYFVDANITDLHLTGASLGDVNLIGTPLPINTDIDGETRNATYPYMGADENLANPLPVELTKFDAVVKGSSVMLEWQTATEVNNYGFEVQRAVNNSNNFETLDFIEGYGNSNSTKSYSYNDKSLVNGKYFYRLKQIDIDGEFEYSDVVAVEIGTPGKYELVQNYPNPFNPTTTIQFSIPEAANVNLTVFNALGEQVSVLANGMFDAGIHKVNFDASNLSSGIYFYQIKTQDFLQIKKMMLVK